MAALSSWAVFETRIFFIMLARCASTVFTLILRRWAISLFLNPVQISSSISCSREVRDSGRRLRGGRIVSGKDALVRPLVVLAAGGMYFAPLQNNGKFCIEFSASWLTIVVGLYAVLLVFVNQKRLVQGGDCMLLLP